MLEKLEHEHKTRLEKQQQQYQDYMQTLETKMKRRFDDYLTLTNGLDTFSFSFIRSIIILYLIIVFKNQD
jgi:hypothetical protein